MAISEVLSYLGKLKPPGISESKANEIRDQRMRGLSD